MATAQERLTQATSALMMGVFLLFVSSLMLPSEGERAGVLVRGLYGVAIIWTLAWTSVVSVHYRAAKAEKDGRA